jgi:hypothetical protein
MRTAVYSALSQRTREEERMRIPTGNDFYNFFGGKSTFFAFWFFLMGSALAWTNKLTANYIGLAGALQIIVSCRSIADDYHVREDKKIDNKKAEESDRHTEEVKKIANGNGGNGHANS